MDRAQHNGKAEQYRQKDQDNDIAAHGATV
jgi:hypothetical protein